MSDNRYFGMYRGTVQNSVDPLMQARLQVKVPSVPGASDLSWAMPCSGYGGSNVGIFSLPPVGTNVWIQFEEGDAASPIWMGIFWDSKTLPPASPAVELMKVFKTDGITVTITDTPGAAMLEIKTAMGAKIALGPSGIEIDNGMGASITLQGPQVSVNGGALEVI
jgi:Type VI secretion system/phage-baseplate injector OB domain